MLRTYIAYFVKLFLKAYFVKLFLKAYFNLPLIYMRHLQQVLGCGTLRHIKHPLVKMHLRKKHLIKGKGTPAMKIDYDDEFRGDGIHKKGKLLKPMKFKF